MAFSLGFITYTISKLVRIKIEPEIDPEFDDPFMDKSDLKKSDTLTFDSEKVARILDNATKPLIEELSKPKTEIPVQSVENTVKSTDGIIHSTDKVDFSEFSNVESNETKTDEVSMIPDLEKSDHQIIEDLFDKIDKTPQELYKEIYEDEITTEYFLKYDYEYGDLQDIKLRNNFVPYESKIQRNNAVKNTERQKDKYNKTLQLRQERLKIEQKKTDEMAMQKSLAELFTNSLKENS